MNTSNFGEILVKLRKKAGMTQQALAERLDCSNKTISKWENCETQPEINVLPKLADIFGVSVDYLLLGERKSIAFAGNILVDAVKDIECYPELGMLATITNVSQSVGGCVPNTGINLAKIDPTIPISAYGCVGEDEKGNYVLNKMRQYNIDVKGVTVLTDVDTSFSDDMNLPNGERTFFHYRGANARFSPEHIDLSQLKCHMLHLGYALLLDKFDEYDEEYGTVMARFLSKVQKKGIKTSIDIVSESSADWKNKIVPTLKYVDYFICNEIECCSCFGLNPYTEDGKLSVKNIKRAMKMALEAGVGEKVIVHCKPAGFCMSKNGEFTCVTSLDVPRKYFKGSVGAGDAFCAGTLYGIYNDYSDKEILEFAAAAAVCNLFAANGIDGMRNKKGILELMATYGRSPMPEVEE